ncbi:MAG TPA: cyclase family protein [Acidobacteriota bacterium]|nr:cyclase family protein [Acidobacteriota bacterium]
MSRFVDLSHEIESGMITYPGLPAPKIIDYLTREASKAHYADGVTFQISTIEMVANTGTYLDSPFHRYADGFDLENLPLESCANLPGIVIHCSSMGTAIDANSIKNRNLSGHAVLFHTGWDKFWRTSEYGGPNPFLTRELCERLVEDGAALVGIDTVNIDDRNDLQRPAHSVLLKAGIPIVEHLCNLQSLPDANFRFFAVPPKVKQFPTFSVRAFAIVN